jgi:hypothetical protein
MLTATGIKKTGLIKKALIVAALAQWDVDHALRVAADLAPPVPKSRAPGRSTRTFKGLHEPEPQLHDAPCTSRKRKQPDSADEASSPTVAVPTPKRQNTSGSGPATPDTESAMPTLGSVQAEHDDDSSARSTSESDAATVSSTNTPATTPEDSDDDRSADKSPEVDDPAPLVGVYTSKMLLTRNGGLRGIRVDEQRPPNSARIINQAEAIKRLDQANQKLAKRIDRTLRCWVPEDSTRKGIKGSRVTKNRAARTSPVSKTMQLGAEQFLEDQQEQEISSPEKVALIAPINDDES